MMLFNSKAIRFNRKLTYSLLKYLTGLDVLSLLYEYPLTYTRTCTA